MRLLLPCSLLPVACFSVVVGAGEVVAALGADEFAAVSGEAVAAGGADLAVMFDGCLDRAGCAGL